jgi:hypothetical protein
MRKTISSQALDSLSSKDAQAKPRASRRKRAVKTAMTPPSIFDRLARALQPALDDIDADWVL